MCHHWEGHLTPQTLLLRRGDGGEIAVKERLRQKEKNGKQNLSVQVKKLTFVPWLCFWKEEGQKRESDTQRQTERERERERRKQNIEERSDNSHAKTSTVLPW